MTSHPSYPGNGSHHLLAIRVTLNYGKRKDKQSSKSTERRGKVARALGRIRERIRMMMMTEAVTN